MTINFIFHGLSKTSRQCDIKCVTARIKKLKRIDEIKTYLDSNPAPDVDTAAEDVIDKFNLELVELPAKIDKNELFVFNLE